MKEVLLGKLKDGMIVAKDVLTKNGQCVLQKGKVLNRQSIMRLSFYNIKTVMVEEENIPGETAVQSAPTQTDSETPAPAEASSHSHAPSQPPVVSRKLQSTHKAQSLQLEHAIALSTIKASFEGYVNNNTPLDMSLLLAKVQALFVSCKTSVELFRMLHNMHSTEDSIYAHSLNVSLICRQFGRWMKFDRDTLDTLTLCGLLHDIGKLKIPEEILNKRGKYTDEEFELVKRHTQYGYQLLQPLSIDDRIKKSARSHHERCDGSGYPSGLTQEDTDEFAMIVAIADVYDAMTAARSYRAPLCPFQVIAKFEQEGLQKYNPKYILVFLQHIAGIYQKHRVLLSDGRSATIVMQGMSQLSKPIVQLDDETCIDLSFESDLTIQAVL